MNTWQNPLNWTGSLGSAFSGLVLRDYAPIDERLVSAGSPPFFSIREFMLGESPPQQDE
jgi:hypothetical protein